MGHPTGSRRLFFALWPDDSTRRALDALSQRVVGKGARSVHPLDLHATLVFLGQVPTERFECVETAADGIRGTHFELDINVLDYWFRPRILWCGPRRTPDALFALVKDLETALGACDFVPEHRPYRMHVTLARKARPQKARVLNPAIPWRVEEFVLAASHSTQGPPRYEILRRWPLD